MPLDPDLASIQEARELCHKAHEAQKELAEFSQEKVDAIVKAMAEAGSQASESLARMAVDETQLGVYEDKVTKNKFATDTVYESIKNLKTVGFVREIPDRKVYEIAEPMGVVAAITPVTNPTSTALYKGLISVKARNAIIISPHPRAAKCTGTAARVMLEAAVAAGAPKNVIGWVTLPTPEGTDELFRHKHVAVILATGGTGLVRAAYSSGKPAYGVGPGNVPAYIESSADVKKAVADILASKCFDNGTICASEQAIISDTAVKDQVVSELKAQGGYFLEPDEIQRVHITAGYAIAGLIALRIVWGFVGPAHARFSNFVRSPGAVLAYLRDVALLRAPRYLGHNPAGGAMIVALLIMLTVTPLTGYMMTTDAFWGMKGLEEFHEAFANLTVGLIVFHVLGVLVSSFGHGENLVKSMITGRKRRS